LAQRYADQLASGGVQRGVIGPREAVRLWDRHLANCAVISELLPVGARVVDVGSGAGLPGLALSCRRADLALDLVESLQRRVAFLRECVQLLGFDDTVRVINGRAEAAVVRATVGDAWWVTARAVATLDQLSRWCLPLLQSGGRLLAMKGDQAEAEVSAHAAMVRGLGGVVEDIVRCGVDVLDAPTTVIVIRKR
jgi:16S rRNA (guanine527-N7)-methyltransferase